MAGSIVTLLVIGVAGCTGTYRDRFVKRRGLGSADSRDGPASLAGAVNRKAAGYRSSDPLLRVR